LRVTARESTDLISTAISPNGTLTSSTLSTGTFGSGDAGNLTLNTGFLRIRQGATIAASTLSSGQAGNIIVSADSIEVSGISANRSRVSAILSQSENNPLTQTTATGNAGDVTINTGTLSILDGAVISTNTVGRGQGGDLQVTTQGLTNLFGSASLSNGRATASGLLTGTLGSGDAGDLTLNTGRLGVRQGAVIAASTVGSSGRAGDVTIIADSIEVRGISTDRSLVSGIGSQSESNLSNQVAATGRAGNVVIDARTLNVRDGATISTNTTGAGRGGNIRITVSEETNLVGIATLRDGSVSSSRLLTGTSGAGNAGNLSLETGRLSIRRAGSISSGTSGSGDAGRIRIQADEAIYMAGLGGEQRQFSSTIFSNILPRGTGDAGNIRVDARSLTLRDGAQVSAAVSRQQRDRQNIIVGGQGRGGDIRLDIEDFIDLSGTSRFGFSSGILSLTERGALGRAGSITVNTGDLRIAEGAAVVASTFNLGRAGNIIINANYLEMTNGGQIVTNTRNTGNAGRIELNINGDINIQGIDTSFASRRSNIQEYIANQPIRSDRFDDVLVNQGRNSGIFANTQQSSEGNGGSISINTMNLNLSDRATVSARSSGSGQAGNISIRARNGTFSSRGGQVSTATSQNIGGEIDITANNVQLNGNSSIATDVGSGDGGGGNIIVNADSVLALDDTTVNASAQEGNTGGQGGNIIFNTPALFESENTTIEARGTTTGQIDRPDVSFIQNSLADIPEAPLDTDRLLTNSCLNRTPQTGRFTRTGTDGLPQRPGNANQSDYSTGTVQSIPEAESRSNRPWRMGDAIVEPQGVHRLPDGRLAMGSNCDAPE
jgi:large exoprotein involved in heme utilization and adhesion